MKPSPFTYHDPTTVSEAVALLGRLENAKPLAGGQSLMPMLNMRYVMVDHLIDLNRIEALAYVRTAGDVVEIGAMTRQRDLEASPVLAERCPLLAEALRFIGHFQTRNRGTIGGSLCHLDPAAELPGVAAAYDAELVVEGQRGQRRLPIAEWPVYSMTPNLEADEILTGIVLRPWPQGHGHAFVEFARRHGDFAIVGVACLLALDAAGRIERAALALVGAGSVPMRLAAAERTLVGETPSAPLFRAAAAECASIEATSDAQISAEYRRHLAAVLVPRALERATARAKQVTR
jgi:carbon-monoxide dehydrogenase medium subunit